MGLLTSPKSAQSEGEEDSIFGRTSPGTLESLPGQENMIILQSLHWLPIKFRISYKILLLAYKALNDLAPAYRTNLLSRYNPTHSLRSQNSGLLVIHRIEKSTKGGRTFSYLAPKLWNSLPDNVQGSDTLSLFKSRLKSHLYSQAFI